MWSNSSCLHHFSTLDTACVYSYLTDISALGHMENNETTFAFLSLPSSCNIPSSEFLSKWYTCDKWWQSIVANTLSSMMRTPVYLARKYTSTPCPRDNISFLNVRSEWSLSTVGSGVCGLGTFCGKSWASSSSLSSLLSIILLFCLWNLQIIPPSQFFI